MTKARALGVIRKGLVSCFGSDSYPAVHCRRPSRGQELTTSNGGYECDPVLAGILSAAVYLPVVSSGP